MGRLDEVKSEGLLGDMVITGIFFYFFFYILYFFFLGGGEEKEHRVGK